jgi:hypothetical protein
MEPEHAWWAEEVLEDLCFLPDTLDCVNRIGHLVSFDLTFGSGSKLSSIEKNAFCRPGTLDKLKIPSSVTFFGGGCFSNCRGPQLLSN